VRTLDRRRRLANRIVFLSGSVPEPDRGFVRVPDAPFVIEQAVVALARAIFAEGGRIVFGAHPSISPLVASVAAEYFPPNTEATMRPVIIYQSEAFKEVLPNDTWDLHRYGYADLIWTDAKGGEQYKIGEPASRKCPKSLTEMRTQMISDQNPIAMVIVGGMDGVEEELKLFCTPPRSTMPVYAALATGGAASTLYAEWKYVYPMHDLEREWSQSAKGALNREASPAESTDPRDKPIPPYGAIMQWLVEQLIANAQL